MANRLALLSLWSIGRMLNGFQSTHEVTEDSMLVREGPEICDSLSRLTSPHFTRKIAELSSYDPSPVGRMTASNQSDEQRDPPVIHEFPPDTARGRYLRSLAKLLTTNSVNPYLIWDNRCRAELEVMLDTTISRMIKTVSIFILYFIAHLSNALLFCQT